MFDLNRPFLTDRQHLETVLNTRRVEFVSRYQITPCMPVTISILIVADGFLDFSESGFGLSKVIDTLTTPLHDFARFKIGIAHRAGLTPPADANNDNDVYPNFRFDQKDSKGKYIIHKYDQIWCFGSTSAYSPDQDISPQELKVLAKWMNERHGGMLAMGDHDELGAAMCSQIPRVKTMRYWKKDDNGNFTVPPAAGSLRYDTNQPATDGQKNIAGVPDEIPFDNQSDEFPQPIEVKPYLLQSERVSPPSYWPHPILCDPARGTINVLPDHPHEGRVVEDKFVDLSAQYNFKDYEGFDYPNNRDNLFQPKPEVIAWANTLADPPYNHDKGTTPAKRFGLVSVYDGHKANVGRVVVDTTWHHWVNTNLDGLESKNPDAYGLIQSYFRNVGLWLATDTQRRRMLCSALWNSVFTAQAMEEYATEMPVEILGKRARDILRKHVGGCMLLDWVQQSFTPYIEVELKEVYLNDPLCLTCPPIVRIQDHLLGGVIQEMLPLRAEMMQSNRLAEASIIEPAAERQMMAAVDQGMKKGFDAFSEAYSQTLERGRAVQPLMADLLNFEIDADQS